jgi:hypothetical protein
MKTLCVNSTDDIFAGSLGGVYRFTNIGNRIEFLDIPIHTWINSLAADLKGNLYATAGGVLRSTDNGKNWQEINNGLILPFGSNAEKLFITNSGDVLAGTAFAGIFRSTNNGDSWIQVDKNLSNSIVNTFCSNSKSNLFAGTADGMWLSRDGNHWIPFEVGLRNVNSLIADSSDFIFASILYDGMFRTTTPINNIDTIFLSNLPSEFILLQNYPNPFNSSTKIIYRILNTTSVSLKVYDLLGREIATLVNEEKPAGNYDIEFDGSSLSSGIYFYKLRAENFSSVKKMILLK